ncbi:ribosomal protein L13-domain-containing protein [Pelagophyceae sp. CCMP2097]|nr:ribosomal protein L13-domain-containing protein [Pelagophyceae sp. CCMP2097]|mmetsp:Transcript_1021/g.3726  ORF Transcript_1021/g.3726 Transcript_1021/m.3726 type:complete len:219 (-) Transcript_1021:237-893(-)
MMSLRSILMKRTTGGLLLHLTGKQQWHQVDAQQKIVGRLAVKIATVLQGKHKPSFEPNRHEHGDWVVVTNADELVFSGKKWDQKVYRWHTGWPGGLKARTAKEMQRRKPGEVLRKAVAGMLPKNKLRRTHMWRLRIFAGVEHPHALQLANSVPSVRRDDLFDNCDAGEDGKTYHKGRNTFASYRQKDIDGPDEWHPERAGHKYAARPDKPRPNSREVK